MKSSTFTQFAFAAIAMVCHNSARAAQEEPEPRTATAVIAADNLWGQAEVDGNIPVLDALLIDEYQTVGADGLIKRKAELIRSAKLRGGRSETLAKAVSDWKSSHPTRSEVVIMGDSAILTWIMKDAAGVDHVSSSDVFTHIDGRWRAAYSQHSKASD